VTSLYLWLKWTHIVSSAVLFGTGAGIAFFFVRAQRSANTRIIAAVAGDVVLADVIFTATAVVLQPVTGIAMALIAGYPIGTPWIALSLVIYCLIGCCWLPVLWLQLRLRNLAAYAAANELPLPAVYRDYYRRWLLLGWPAFMGVLVIFYLMIAKPKLWG
jgi:uncharacterized membrane protein